MDEHGRLIVERCAWQLPGCTGSQEPVPAGAIATHGLCPSCLAAELAKLTNPKGERA